MNRNNAEAVAASMPGMQRVDLSANCRELEDGSGIHFWDPARGGSAVIVAADGTFLWASSGVRPDQHLEAFIAGKRSDPERFGGASGV